MALTKVTGSGVEGITNLSNATFLSVDASEVATLLTSAVINSEGGAVTTNIAQGLAKSWCHFDGGSFGIEDSFNVASADDNGAGSYDVNYTNNFASANNCPTGLANNFTLFINGDPTTSTFILGTRNSSNTSVDSTTVATKTHGDLA